MRARHQHPLAKVGLHPAAHRRSRGARAECGIAGVGIEQPPHGLAALSNPRGGCAGIAQIRFELERRRAAGKLRSRRLVELGELALRHEIRHHHVASLLELRDLRLDRCHGPFSAAAHACLDQPGRNALFCAVTH